MAQDNQEDDLLAGLVGFDEPIGLGTNDEMTMIMQEQEYNAKKMKRAMTM